MKHLTRHLDRLRACLAQLPDPRRGRNRQYTMQDKVGDFAFRIYFAQPVAGRHRPRTQLREAADTLHLRKATALEPHQKPIYDALGIQPDAGGFVKKVI